MRCRSQLIQPTMSLAESGWSRSMISSATRGAPAEAMPLTVARSASGLGAVTAAGAATVAATGAEAVAAFGATAVAGAGADLVVAAGAVLAGCFLTAGFAA